MDTADFINVVRFLLVGVAVAFIMVAISAGASP